jgi:hypothetical protein
MAKDEDLGFALSRGIARGDPDDQPKDELADREEHRPMILSPRSRIGTLVFDPFRTCCRESATVAPVRCSIHFSR